jgi:phosphoribosylamine-glycine ligase
MKFLFLSEAGAGLGIALRVLDEGNEVAMWIRGLDHQSIGDGLVPKVTDWKFSIDPETNIIADVNGFGCIMDALRLGGFPTACGNVLADRLEADRKFADEVMHDCGIKTPKSWSFKDWDKATDFVDEFEGRLVFKPTGDLSGVVPSYVSLGREDMLEALDHAERKSYGEPEFELQEFLEGVALSTEGWFNGLDFLKPFNHTIERKQLMNGDLGPSGGCTGNVVWARPDDCPLLCGMTKFLAGHHYIGPIDINAIVTEDGKAYGLEFTPRFGYDAAPTLFLELFDGEVGKFLSDLARDQSSVEMPLRPGFGAGVRVTLSPWPHKEGKSESGVTIRGLDKGDLNHFDPCSLMLGSRKELVKADGSNVVGVVTGHGDSVRSAFNKAYKIADKLKVPGKQFRTDLADVVRDDLEKLGISEEEIASGVQQNVG